MKAEAMSYSDLFDMARIIVRNHPEVFALIGTKGVRKIALSGVRARDRGGDMSAVIDAVKKSLRSQVVAKEFAQRTCCGVFDCIGEAQREVTVQRSNVLSPSLDSKAESPHP